MLSSAGYMFGGADLRRGDVLLSLDGTPVPTVEAVEAFFAKAKEVSAAAVLVSAFRGDLHKNSPGAVHDSSLPEPLLMDCRASR